MLWPLFSWSALLSQLMWWRARHNRALAWPLFAWSALARPTCVVASKTGEGTGLASVRLVSVGTVSHFGGGQNRRVRLTDLCSRCRSWLGEPLRRLADRQGRWCGLAYNLLVGMVSVTVVAGRYARAFVWSPLFLFSAWTVVARRKQVHWSGIASISLVDLGPFAVVASR